MPSMSSARAADESVYNLIPQAQEVLSKPPIHRSKFAGTVNPSELEFGVNRISSHSTMGRPNGTNAIPPSTILLKHSKEPILPEPFAPTTTKLRTKALVPRKEEVPVMGLTSNKNFITANAVEVILAQPGKVPQDEFIWTNKRGYGEVPMYLKRNKSMVATEREQFEQYLRLREAPSELSRISQLDPGDRAELLRHLKKKWGSINGAYQKLSLSVDSAVKRHQKEEMERQLAEVEKDIKTLERGETVLVVSD